jgi:hypothetical protein
MALSYPDAAGKFCLRCVKLAEGSARIRPELRRFDPPDCPGYSLSVLPVSIQRQLKPKTTCFCDDNCPRITICKIGILRIEFISWQMISNIAIFSLARLKL